MRRAALRTVPPIHGIRRNDTAGPVFIGAGDEVASGYHTSALTGSIACVEPVASSSGAVPSLLILVRA